MQFIPHDSNNFLKKLSSENNDSLWQNIVSELVIIFLKIEKNEVNSCSLPVYKMLNFSSLIKAGIQKSVGV